MKKLLLTALTIVACLSSYAQIQNTFPTRGQVGIGNLHPVGNLEVVDTATGSKFNFRYVPTIDDNTGLGYSASKLEFLQFGGDGSASISSLNFINSNLILDPGVGNNFGQGGYVGVATLTPNAKLDVSGNFMVGGGDANLDPTGAAVDITTMQNSGKLLVGWNRTASEGETDFIGNQGVGINGGFAFYNYNNSGIMTELIKFKGNGNVGIGITNPDSKLSVNGTVHSKEVKVDLNGWPDYVFKPTYHLPTLFEVQTYIAQNHHLPDMPSEAEVIKNGINLGEMNKILTKKVEELTLYLIEKDKEAQKQQAQIDQLNRKLDALIEKGEASNK